MLLVERIRVFYQRVANEIRELEKYKEKRGICTGGMSCTRKALQGPRGGMRDCPHHAASRKAGIKLRRWQAYESEYGRLRKEMIEREKAEKERAEKEKKKPAKKKKRAA